MSRWKLSLALILISLSEIVTFRRLPDFWTAWKRHEEAHPRLRRSVYSNDEDGSSNTLRTHYFEGPPELFSLAANESIILYGLSIEYDSDKKRIWYDQEGCPHVMEGMDVSFRLYGKFIKGMMLKLTMFNLCQNDEDAREEPTEVSVHNSGHMGFVETKMPLSTQERREVSICLRGSESDPWVKQDKSWLLFKLYKKILPMWLHVILLMILLGLSGLFSGLNLGLMSLNKTDLKIIINTGNTEEKKFASKIAPVRNHGNFLLCCLLFSNVLVNASLTILMDELTSGLVAIIMSTLFIVVFGEIIPQAICSRFGLAVGAKTIYITKFFMLITFPLAYPLSKVLDRLLGEEIGNVYTRERLKELLKVTKDHHGLENEEVEIISGALDMKSKTVKDIMTKIEHVFMLPIDALLDYDTMAEVEYHGYSRIPVYENNRSNIVAVLNIKQLTLLDAGDRVALKTLVEYYKTNSRLFFVFENTRLDYMFRAFREGSRGHMAFVQRVNTEGAGDPFYETIGIVTMEDVLEELLQADIMDETDVGKLEARNNARPKDAPYMKRRKYKTSVDIPPPLALAAVQYLSTTVEPFKSPYLSVPIIQRLIRTSCHFLKAPKFRPYQEEPVRFLYEFGKPSEYFIIILEGRVQVSVGKERLVFEAGPFTTFGTEFLMADPLESNSMASVEYIPRPKTAEGEERPPFKKVTFRPDYTVKLVTDVYYMSLKHTSYRAGKLATVLEKSSQKKPSTTLSWQDEIEKMLNEADEEDPTQYKYNFETNKVREPGPKSTSKELACVPEETQALLS